MSKDIYDITIIGGGPTGMFASFYSGMRELKTKVIESLPVLGGQIELMYPEKMIFDIGAFPFIKGKDLISNLKQQMEPFQSNICLKEHVLEIHKEDNFFILKTNHTIHYSKTILITTGQGDFEPRKLNLPDADKYENLHYYVHDLHMYKDKIVTVFGGGDSALDWALMLETVAKKVYIVHRRDHFRGLESSVTKLRNSSVEIITPFSPVELIGKNNKIKEVIIQKRRKEIFKNISTDYVIVSYGFKSDNKQLEEWGLETTHNSILVSPKMETNIPGIYAAGDVATFDGKVKLIAAAFGEVPTAVNSIVQYLNPDQLVQAPLSAQLDIEDKIIK